MKVLVLGGKGFVGSAFVRSCEKQGREFSIVELDNYEKMVGQECELLINADGNSRKYLADDNPQEDYRLSVASVQQSLLDFNFRKYVYISSIDVYPDAGRPDLTGEEIIPDVTRQSNYGFHKYLGELLVRHYAAAWMIVRLGGVLGPHLRKNPVFDLLHERPLRVDEESEYQYLFTDFVAETVFKLAEKNKWGEVFNVCGAGTVSLREIRSWLNKPLRYFQEAVPRERYDVNIEKISKLFEIPESREVAREFVLSESNQDRK